MDMTPSHFTFIFSHHSAERQRDVAKEKGLVFQLDRFREQLKPQLLQRHFLKSVKLTL